MEGRKRLEICHGEGVFVDLAEGGLYPFTPMKKITVCMVAALFALLGANLWGAQVENPRVQWMKGKYGVMVHWLFLGYDGGKTENIDKTANSFDLDAFMKCFDATGAEWLIFTIGQNTGAYASPNSVIDKYCGPGHTSKRDLVLEIAKAVHERGKKFIAYAPCEVRGNKSMRDGMAWNDDIQDNKAEFQKRYTDMLREWSVRYGKYCDGWWIDGAYGDIAPHMDWDLWHKALRAGNPNAVVTFNPGIITTNRIALLHPDHDYIAGEVVVLVDGKIRGGRNNTDPQAFMPQSGYYGGTKTLWHVLFPMDSFWGAYSNWSEWAFVPWKCEDVSKSRKIHPPVYSKKNFWKFLDGMSKVGAAVTVNMGVTPEGHLSQESIKMFKK